MLLNFKAFVVEVTTCIAVASNHSIVLSLFHSTSGQPRPFLFPRICESGLEKVIQS